jgi:hypothetical protein
LHNNFVECWPCSEGKHDFPSGVNNFGQVVETGDRIKARNMPVIAIMKPFDKWLRSIKRNPAGLQQRHPEIYNGEVIDPDKAEEYHGRFYQAWREYGVRLYELNYINLLRDTPAILAGLGERLGLVFNGGAWNLKGADWRWDEKRRSYYLDGDSALTS